MPFRRDAARLKRGFQCAVRWGGLERQFDPAPGAENDRGAHGHIKARIEPNPVDLRQRDFRIPFAGEPPGRVKSPSSPMIQPEASSQSHAAVRAAQIMGNSNRAVRLRARRR